MKNRILFLILLLPLLIVFINYGIASNLKLIINLKAEYIELEHNQVEQVELGVPYKLYAKAYPLSSTNNEIIWSVSDESIAKIENGMLVSNDKEGQVIITASLKDNSIPSKSFVVNIVSFDENPKFINVIDIRDTETGLDETYYYGMYRWNEGQLIKDTIELDIKVYPLSASQEVDVIVSDSEAVNFNDNKMSFNKGGDYSLLIKSRVNSEIKTTYNFSVVEDGVNVYSYDDLIRCTNESISGEIVIMQTNLESKANLNRSNSSIFGYEDENGNLSFSYQLIDSNYDTLYYTNSNMPVPKLKVAVNFKKDVYGNGFTINLHELCYPSLIQSGTNKPIPSDKDLYNGPLLFISAAGLSVYGQDNIGFYVSNDNVTLRNISLKNSNNVTDLTHLDYVGTTLEIGGDNVTIKDCIISNGRTVVRSFSNENLLIEGSLLQYAREFILKVGSNNFVRSTKDAQGNLIELAPLPKDENGNILSDLSCKIKDTYFYTSGLFSIGIDTHFAGILLFDGTKYIDAARDLAATSYASKITLEGDVRFYDWKNINNIDSSTLISGNNSISLFNIAGLLEDMNAFYPILKQVNNEKYVYGGIAFYGGGRNLSTIEFIDNTIKDDSLNIEVSLTDSRLNNINSILALAAGEHPFRFFIYPNSYDLISINDTPSMNELINH